MKVVFAERAQRDISDIYDSIAKDSAAAAQRVEDAIRLECDRLGDFPDASSETDEPNVRRVPLVRYPYTIYFRINRQRDIVEIARVTHGARVQDLRRLPPEDR